VCFIRLHIFPTNTFQSDKYLASFVLDFLAETRDALHVHFSLELSHFNEIELEEYLFLKFSNLTYYENLCRNS